MKDDFLIESVIGFKHRDIPIQVMENDGSKILLVQAWEKFKALGVLNVEFNEAGEVVSYNGNPIPQTCEIVLDSFLPF